MLQQLINHSPDLQKLRNTGYEMQLKGGYLLIHHIPYVTSEKIIKYGTLVTMLDRNGNKTLVPATHVLYFMGEAPCFQNGEKMVAVINQTANIQLTPDLLVNHTFSSRPLEGYTDYYHKITTYIDLLAAPAVSLDPAVTACTHKLIADEDEASVFNYYDTNSSRANIEAINNKFKGLRIAIIGLGGTGSYILDLVSKCPVAEIHLFDGDYFLQHNSFRAPGAATAAQFENEQMKKVDYFRNIYANVHKRIVMHPYFIDAEHLHKLENFSFVFICVDKSSVRKMLVSYLVANKIFFIDTGMGVQVIDDAISGMIRTTCGTSLKNDHLEKRIPAEDDDDNAYSSNIQVAELNMYNAASAVIKWKKLYGFYHDSTKEHDGCYIIHKSEIINEDAAA
jgi:hypothetical protein